ncbi:hypothetical protein DTL42_13250 [Bremerella cremea]|uniref:Uncharacterized protein n=2 Tax=Bremerella cremea TaxID=1031537 RepID=A0A368KRG9_9BACT|nr:hypothetical protein DTL42_13250 [Bremerella cremea]
MPEVRFDDVMEVCTNRAVTEVPIDPKYVEVCEPNSIRVCGAVPNLPVFVGASVSRGTLVIRLDKPSDEKVTISVRLTGIRRGFENKRFPNRSREQFEANERFIRSAYPGD